MLMHLNPFNMLLGVFFFYRKGAIIIIVSDTFATRTCALISKSYFLYVIMGEGFGGIYQYF